MSVAPRRSTIELAAEASSALLIGCGGGGDVIQTIPVMNYLRALGVERFLLAGLGCKWWGDVGLRFGCEVMRLDWLEPGEPLGEHARLVGPDTTVTEGRGAGRMLHDAAVARETGAEVAVIDVRGGVPGVLAGMRALASRADADLVVLVDIGSDSFFTGSETTVVSPLLDAVSMHCVNALDVPSVFALTGYGCDCEIPVPVLHRNVAIAMQHGGYLGAHGLTPRDAADLERVLDHFPQSDAERRPYRAARGELGTFPAKRFWSIEVTPLAAITLFFALDVLIEHVNPLPAAIAGTATLQEAEEVVLARGLFPETRLPQQIAAPTDPQVPAPAPRE
jgi:hypothetical protein